MKKKIESKRISMKAICKWYDSDFYILQVFELLWCLVCHDIWFVWERSDFLQQSDDGSLLSKQFTVSY